MRKIIFGIAIGIIASLIVSLIRQQQESARSAPLMREAHETIERVEREIAERRLEKVQETAEFDQLFEENNRATKNIDQTISHIRTLIREGRSDN